MKNEDALHSLVDLAKNHTNTVLQSLAESLQAKSDSAYCDYVRMFRNRCSGMEFKLEHGKFSESDLKAHCEAAEAFGRHRALSEAVKMINAIINS